MKMGEDESKRRGGGKERKAAGVEGGGEDKKADENWKTKGFCGFTDSRKCRLVEKQARVKAGEGKMAESIENKGEQ